MKHFNLIFIYSLLFMACDSHELPTESETHQYSSNTILMRGTELPFNSSNPYDIAGQVHSDIFNAYYDLPSLPSSLDSIIALVEVEMSYHDYFDSLPNFDYHQFSTAYFDSIIKQPAASLTHALNASLLSTSAKDSLETFISTLFLKVDAEDDYEIVYDFIIDYEDSILNSTNYSHLEKEFILTVTSIARHSIYNKEKKPKPNTDPDWDWLTTCIVGSVDGAVYNVPESIATALKAGIGAE